MPHSQTEEEAVEDDRRQRDAARSWTTSPSADSFSSLARFGGPNAVSANQGKQPAAQQTAASAMPEQLGSTKRSGRGIARRTAARDPLRAGAVRSDPERILPHARGREAAKSSPVCHRCPAPARWRRTPKIGTGLRSLKSASPDPEMVLCWVSLSWQMDQRPGLSSSSPRQYTQVDRWPEIGPAPSGPSGSMIV